MVVYKRFNVTVQCKVEFTRLFLNKLAFCGA